MWDTWAGGGGVARGGFGGGGGGVEMPKTAWDGMNGGNKPTAEPCVSGGRKGTMAIQASAPALAARSDVAEAA